MNIKLFSILPILLLVNFAFSCLPLLPAPILLKIAEFANEGQIHSTLAINGTCKELYKKSLDNIAKPGDPEILISHAERSIKKPPLFHLPIGLQERIMQLEGYERENHGQGISFNGQTTRIAIEILRPNLLIMHPMGLKLTISELYAMKLKDFIIFPHSTDQSISIRIASQFDPEDEYLVIKTHDCNYGEVLCALSENYLTREYPKKDDHLFSPSFPNIAFVDDNPFSFDEPGLQMGCQRFFGINGQIVEPVGFNRLECSKRYFGFNSHEGIVYTVEKWLSDKGKVVHSFNTIFKLISSVYNKRPECELWFKILMNDIDESEIRFGLTRLAFSQIVSVLETNLRFMEPYFDHRVSTAMINETEAQVSFNGGKFGIKLDQSEGGGQIIKIANQYS